MIQAIKGRARYIRAGILSASVLTFIPVLSLVQSHTRAAATDSAAAASAPVSPTPPPTAGNYGYSGRNGRDDRYAYGGPSASRPAPAPSSPGPSAAQQAPHTRSRGS